MSYRVKVEAFEGPFDLLLHLVSRQKVDISAISIADIADQYLAEIDRMRDLDLDVASDFLVVAATLLQMKASSLIPAETSEPEIDDEFDDLTPEQARDILVERLIVYKQFKSAAAALGARMENEGHMHPRHAALEPQFSGLVPDYLEGMTLHGLAVICADIASRRDTFLLEAEHIAAVPISMEKHVEGIYRTMCRRRPASPCSPGRCACRCRWRPGWAPGPRCRPGPSPPCLPGAGRRRLRCPPPRPEPECPCQKAGMPKQRRRWGPQPLPGWGERLGPAVPAGRCCGGR